MTWKIENKSSDKQVKSSGWSDYNLNKVLVKGLRSKGFNNPTDIQKKVLPLALKGKDIIGAAETGSGKTLAFGLPILNEIAFSVEQYGKDAVANHLFALILAPTRELALQIKAHLDQVAKYIKFSSKSTCDGAMVVEKSFPPEIVAVVGGISIQKQKRQLGLDSTHSPQVIIATPGRLWDLLQNETQFIEKRLRAVSYLVIDEADKMLEKGSFEELKKVLALLSDKYKRDTAWEVECAIEDAIEQVEVDTNDSLTRQIAKLETPKAATAVESENEEVVEINRQTMVFSATLINSKRVQKLLANKSVKNSKGMMMEFDALLEVVGFRNKPKIVSIVPRRIMSARIIEKRIHCLPNEKYKYLCYLLACYPSVQAIVFVNTVPEARKLSSFLELVRPGLPIFSLHAQMPQKQRLSAVESFSACHNGAVLVATDVAARGLDIPSVQLVVHFDVPHTPALYVHRSGRSARKNSGNSDGERGVSLLLVTSSEFTAYKRICKTLAALSQGSGEPETELIPPLLVDEGLVEQLQPLAQLALQIVNLELSERLTTKDSSWLKKAAEALDVDIPSDMESDTDPAPLKRHKLAESADLHKITALKLELGRLLKLPLLERSLRNFRKEHKISESNVDQYSKIFSSKPGIVSTSDLLIAKDSL